MAEFKSRMYGIVHGGYNLLVDSKANNQGTKIDGQIIRTTPVRRDGEVIGHRPTCPSKKVANPPYLNCLIFKNSDYMGNYVKVFGQQVKKWLGQDCLMPYRRTEPHSDFLGDILVHKSTIEPKKPRICLK